MNSFSKPLIAFSIAFALFSGFQTALGYSEISLIASIVLASFSSIFFIILNKAIIQNRASGESNLKVLLFYLFILLISFGGNFVTFYSNLIKDRFFHDELQKNLDRLNQIDDYIIDYVSNLNSKLDNQEKLLIQQINRKGYEGCGIECDRIIKEINNELLKHSNNLRIDVDKYVKSERNHINTINYFKEQFKSIKNILINKVNLEISNDTLFKKSKISLEKAIFENLELSEYKEKYNSSIKSYNTIISKYSGSILNLNKEFKLVNEKPHLEFGQIVYSYETAFSSFKYPFYVISAIFLSLFVDLTMPIAISVLVKKDRKKRLFNHKQKSGYIRKRVRNIRQ